MRRFGFALAASVALSAAIMAPSGASAAPVATISAGGAGAVHRVQYWDQRPYDGGWERRQQWREWRRERDEARIAEAARREAWRIEQEREQGRAWRHQSGYGPRYDRWW
ncbi:hypothetical protein [Pseudoroseomonas sp. WGS1072]|uniref:hypothetical protein n=1 Tax=Roseomonas sp. WGS1072 TaxID=3366816 RepID=UPI003BF3C0AB